MHVYTYVMYLWMDMICLGPFGPPTQAGACKFCAFVGEISLVKNSGPQHVRGCPRCDCADAPSGKHTKHYERSCEMGKLDGNDMVYPGYDMVDPLVISHDYEKSPC